MRKLSFLLGLAVALGTSPLQAAPVTYDFTVTEGGVSSSGHFTFDDSIIPDGYDIVHGPVLTDLSFTWNSIAYDETTANTGWLRFDPDGELIDATFGTNCSETSCLTPPSTSDWYFAYFYSPSSYGEFQDAGGKTRDVKSSLRISAVPEPGALALIGIGLAGIAAGLRRRQ